MAWLLLFVAIALEVCATIQLKLSQGFTKFDYSVSTVILFLLSFLFAAFAFKKIDLSLGYSLWSGIGTIGIVASGILYFNEPSSLIKLGFASLIVIGVIGLNYVS